MTHNSARWDSFFIFEEPEKLCSGSKMTLPNSTALKLKVILRAGSFVRVAQVKEKNSSIKQNPIIDKISPNTQNRLKKQNRPSVSKRAVCFLNVF